MSSKLIANLECVHCCHGSRSRKVQTAKIVVTLCCLGELFREIKVFSSKNIVYFAEMIRKQGN